MILILYFVWRILDFLFIFFGRQYLHYLGSFPYASQLPKFGLPTWVSALANFDGLHYVSIARQGYGQYEQAFFPLYPLSIKIIAPFFSNNQLLTGIIISNLSFLLGLFIFFKYLSLVLTGKNRSLLFSIVIFLLAFPTAFFFGSVYTEGLFFFLIVTSLYYLKKENYLCVVIFVFLASLTRFVGVFLIIPIIFHLIQKLKVKNQNLMSKSKSLLFLILNTKYLILILSPILGLLTYCIYLFKTTGNPFYFFSSQSSFGLGRSTHLITFIQVYWRYFKIFMTANHDFAYFVSILEFSFFTFIFLILTADLFKNIKIYNNRIRILNFDLVGLNLFSFINLILPTFTGTFLSVPRFSLMSLSTFIYIAQIKNNFIRNIILVVFLYLHVVLLGLFTQGYFIS